ncbi:MAG: HD domain-containing protein [Campylobacteraceae bacterium]|nr:HD domain-containing protein [Campylobacteraceae bacterium]
MRTYEHACNVSTGESYIRLIAAIILFSLGFYYSMPMAYLMAIYVAYTAVRKYCYMNTLFGLNKVFSLKSFYLSNLPKYNPEPVFIIDSDSLVVYKNKPAKILFPHTDDFNFLCSLDEVKRTINSNKLIRIKYTFTPDKIYLFALQGVKSSSSIFVYGADITSAVQAEAEIINTQKEVVYAMGEIGETRSKETGNHVKRVAKYSKLLALKYGLSLADAELLTMASPMHDIGKVGIPDAILNKPGKLTPDEFVIMKTHAELGYKMLKNSNKAILKTAAIVANEHHEKWDGSGYPQGLKGDEIHIFGRITALADVFDALGSNRVYKKAWDLDRILKLFEEEKGKHFDPTLIDLFMGNLDDFIAIRDKYKD